MATQAEIGYLAGIIDGEGCMRWKGNGGRKGYPNLVVKMTDLDVLERLQRITNSGIVRPVRNIPAGLKPQWIWDVSRQKQVVGILMTVYPLVSARRQAKIVDVLRFWRGQTLVRST